MAPLAVYGNRRQRKARFSPQRLVVASVGLGLAQCASGLHISSNTFTGGETGVAISQITSGTDIDPSQVVSPETYEAGIASLEAALEETDAEIQARFDTLNINDVQRQDPGVPSEYDILTRNRYFYGTQSGAILDAFLEIYGEPKQSESRDGRSLSEKYYVAQAPDHIHYIPYNLGGEVSHGNFGEMTLSMDGGLTGVQTPKSLSQGISTVLEKQSKVGLPVPGPVMEKCNYRTYKWNFIYNVFKTGFDESRDRHPLPTVVPYKGCIDGSWYMSEVFGIEMGFRFKFPFFNYPRNDDSSTRITGMRYDREATFIEVMLVSRADNHMIVTVPIVLCTKSSEECDASFESQLASVARTEGETGDLAMYVRQMSEIKIHIQDFPVFAAGVDTEILANFEGGFVNVTDPSFQVNEYRHDGRDQRLVDEEAMLTVDFDFTATLLNVDAKGRTTRSGTTKSFDIMAQKGNLVFGQLKKWGDFLIVSDEFSTYESNYANFLVNRNTVLPDVLRSNYYELFVGSAATRYYKNRLGPHMDYQYNDGNNYNAFASDVGSTGVFNMYNGTQKVQSLDDIPVKSPSVVASSQAHTITPTSVTGTSAWELLVEVSTGFPSKFAWKQLALNVFIHEIWHMTQFHVFGATGGISMEPTKNKDTIATQQHMRKMARKVTQNFPVNRMTLEPPARKINPDALLTYFRTGTNSWGFGSIEGQAVFIELHPTFANNIVWPLRYHQALGFGYNYNTSLAGLVSNGKSFMTSKNTILSSLRNRVENSSEEDPDSDSVSYPEFSYDGFLWFSFLSNYDYPMDDGLVKPAVFVEFMKNLAGYGKQSLPFLLNIFLPSIDLFNKGVPLDDLPLFSEPFPEALTMRYVFQKSLDDTQGTNGATVDELYRNFVVATNILIGQTECSEMGVPTKYCFPDWVGDQLDAIEGQKLGKTYGEEGDLEYARQAVMNSLRSIVDDFTSNAPRPPDFALTQPKVGPLDANWVDLIADYEVWNLLVPWLDEVRNNANGRPIAKGDAADAGADPETYRISPMGSRTFMIEAGTQEFVMKCDAVGSGAPLEATALVFSFIRGEEWMEETTVFACDGLPHTVTVPAGASKPKVIVYNTEEDLQEGYDGRGNIDVSFVTKLDLTNLILLNGDDITDRVSNKNVYGPMRSKFFDIEAPMFVMPQGNRNVTEDDVAPGMGLQCFADQYADQIAGKIVIALDHNPYEADYCDLSGTLGEDLGNYFFTAGLSKIQSAGAVGIILHVPRFGEKEFTMSWSNFPKITIPTLAMGGDYLNRFVGVEEGAMARMVGDFPVRDEAIYEKFIGYDSLA